MLSETEQADVNVVSRAAVLFEFLDHVEDVGVDVVRVAGIEENVRAVRNGFERLRQRRPVQETHLIGECDVQDVAADVLFHNPPQGTAEITREDEADARGQADHHTHQQIGKDDGKDGDEERQHLRPFLLREAFPLLDIDQLDPSHDQDCRHARIRNAIEELGEQCDTDGQKDSVHDRGHSRPGTGVNIH